MKPECWRPDPQPVVLENPMRLIRLPIGEAVALKAHLDAHGVKGALHEECSGVIGHAEFPCGSLWIERSELNRSRELIAEWKAAPGQQHKP